MDNINKPSHYMLDGLDGVEVKDVIRSVLGDDIVSFYIGNVIKYVLRYKKKNGVEDLKKARLYLDWAITDYENNRELAPEMVDKILKNTTAFSAPGRQTVWAVTGPNGEGLRREVKIAADKNLKEEEDRFDEYLVRQIMREEEKNEEEK